MNAKLSALALAATLAALAALPASAAVVAYNSLSAFNLAVTGAASHNFEGIAPAGDFAFGPDFTVDGVTFSAPSGAGFVIDANAIDPSSGFPFANYGASFFTGQGNPPPGGGSANVTLAGATAIGFFYGSYVNDATLGSVTLNTGDAFQFQFPAAAGVDVNFIGFVSDGPLLNSLSFTSNGTTIDFTQFITARANVPEPASLLLVGGALLGLGATRRRAAR